jgi:hypothetical protein
MKFAVAFIIFLLFFTGFVMSNRCPDYQPSKGEQLVNSILAKTAEIIKKKHNIKPSGAGAAMPGGPIKELTLCFDTKGPYSKEQLRGLLIKSAHELLKQVNECEAIQQFIKNPPFTIRNVEIIIYNNDKGGNDVYDPEISTGSISQGNLIYRTTDKDDDFKYKNRFEESYEEALKAIKE